MAKLQHLSTYTQIQDRRGRGGETDRHGTRARTHTHRGQGGTRWTHTVMHLRDPRFLYGPFIPYTSWCHLILNFSYLSKTQKTIKQNKSQGNQEHIITFRSSTLHSHPSLKYIHIYTYLYRYYTSTPNSLFSTRPKGKKENNQKNFFTPNR